MLSDQQVRLADLYWQTKSVRFGEFKLSVHRDRPYLPLSPIYLHYPAYGVTDELRELFDLAGKLMMQSAAKLSFDLIGEVPFGATPLRIAALEFLGRQDDYAVFAKSVEPDGTVRFTANMDLPSQPKIMLGMDDHVSGGKNGLLFIAAAREFGFTVSDHVCVVDREQGARQNLQKRGVTVHSVLTLSQLVNYYLECGYISAHQREVVTTYIAKNQFTM